MEGHGQDRYGRPTAQNRGYDQTYRGIQGSGVSERYQQSQAQGFEPGAAGASQRPGSGGYIFPTTQPQYGGQYPNNPIAYPSTFDTEAGRPQQQQYPLQFQQGMVYGMNQPSGGYDPSPAYAGRPQPSMSGSPQQYPMSTYYAGGYGGPGIQPATPTQGFPEDVSSYPSASHRPGRDIIQHQYPHMDFQQQQPNPIFRLPESQPAASQARPNDAYDEYLHKLRAAYEAVEIGQLSTAGPRLVDASDFLLDQERVQALGLNSDDEAMQEQRLRMWTDFNVCWLAFMQKLKELLESTIQSGEQPSQPQSLITPAYLDEMGDKVVAWADGIERWGLVDYETGLWEEEIIDVAIECRTLFGMQPDLFADAQNQPP